MNSENCAKLNKFKFYRGYHNRGIYFEVGDGWFNLLYELSLEIDKLISEGKESKSFSVIQVKSKFGGLRFYTNGHRDETDDLITKYEILSEKTCEDCGKPANMVLIRGWLYTLCSKCATETINKDKSLQN